MPEEAELNKTELIDSLLSKLELLHIACNQNQANILIEHLLLVLQANRTTNLTAINDIQTAVILHTIDSLLPALSPCVCMDPETTFIDIGSGGGFPGIPLAVITGAFGHLVDSVRKKTEALTYFKEKLKLSNISVYNGRIEDYAKAYPESVDFVFARAVDSANVLVEYASPLLKSGGILAIQKGKPKDIEIDQAIKAADICGMNFVSRETFELPHGLGHRENLIFKKTKPAEISLPRKTGKAHKKPLGV